MFKKYVNLKKIIQNNKRKIRYGQNLGKSLKFKSRVSLFTAIDELPFVKSNGKTLAKIILRNPAKRSEWSETARILAQNIHYVSPACYKFLRSHLNINLPNLASIYRWIPYKNLNPGFNNKVAKNLKKIIVSWNNASREAILIVDEVAIRKELNYDTVKDEIIGFADLGYSKENIIGKQVCVFIVRGLFEQWKFVISYYISGTSISGLKLAELMQKNKEHCTEIGFNVRAIVCDQASSNNKSAYKILKYSENDWFLNYNSSRIYLLYDPPHLIKSVRNTLLKRDIECEDGIVSWDCVKDLFNIEKQKSTKMCHKLTLCHVFPIAGKK